MMSRLYKRMKNNTYQLRIRSNTFLSKKLHFIVVRPGVDNEAIQKEHKNFFKVFPVATNEHYKAVAKASAVFSSIKRYEDISRLPLASEPKNMSSSPKKVTTKHK